MSIKFTKEVNKQLRSLLNKATPDLSSRIINVFYAEIPDNGDAVCNPTTKEFKDYDKACSYAQKQAKKSQTAVVYIVVPWGYTLVK